MADDSLDFQDMNDDDSDGERGAPDTTRDVKAAFNWTSSTLGLTLVAGSTYTNGTWIVAPPSSIPPASSNLRGDPHNWRSDGPDAGGQVTYQVGSSSSTLVMSWTSVDGAVNSYTISSDSASVANISVSGSDGTAATVTYTA